MLSNKAAASAKDKLWELCCNRLHDAVFCEARDRPDSGEDPPLRRPFKAGFLADDSRSEGGL